MTAPKETWRAVRITAGAAAALITNTAERGVQDTADEQQADESLGESQRTPVRRAKERWREARSDMPEVASLQLWLVSTLCIGKHQV